MAATFPVTQSQAIYDSLALLAARDDDPTGLVFERLFARHPDYVGFFRRDTNNAVKGEMLARTFSTLLEFLEDRQYAAYQIASDMVAHEGYDVPREAFITFFAVVRDVIRDLHQEQWTQAYEAAWAHLISDIETFLNRTPRSDVDYTVAHSA
jgi:hemoglobin-like flavoprotein